MSRTSHLVGGILALAGGYLIGYNSGAQGLLRSELGALNGFVNALPLIPGLLDQVSVSDWYLSAGSLLVVVGLLLVLLGGGGMSKETNQGKKNTPTPPVQTRPPGSCKFCGADLKGSKTYCPRCGRSQT